MTFLPIAHRELRVAARRKFTWRSRVIVAGFALLILGLLSGLLSLSRGALPIAQANFAVLKWLTFLASCLAGVFFTSDAVSEEKREGTFGLLFLTDLRGYDVITGKLLSHSLRAFYGVLAAFPVMALPLLAGGVTGREFALSLLAIVNTLFLSLSVGLLVSTVSRDYLKAASSTVLGILILLFAPSLADSLLGASGRTGSGLSFELLSPGWLFSETGSFRPQHFWLSLLLQHLLVWIFLLLASLLAPRMWQENAASTQGVRASLARRWRFGSTRTRTAVRRRWLDSHPVHWLALRDRWLMRTAFLLAAVVLLLQGGSLVAGFIGYYLKASVSSAGIFATVAATFQRLISIALYLWVAAKASHLFIESMRNGAFELLLVTPVAPRVIVRAQWAALCRTFLLPVLCIIVLQTAGGFLTGLQTSRAITTAAAPPLTITNATGPVLVTNTVSSIKITGPGSISVTTSAAGLNSSWPVFYEMATLVLSAASLIAGLAAVGWFGMWMGLTNRKISVAVTKTICFVSLLPLIAYGFIYGFTMVLTTFAVRRSPSPYNIYDTLLIGAFVSAIFNLAKDAIFIIWARRRLLSQFRNRVSGDQEAGRRRPRIPPVASMPLTTA